MTNIKVFKLQDKHIPQLWDIVPSDYFDDNSKINALGKFKEYFKQNVTCGLVAIGDNEVIGCSYIDKIHDGFGQINIIIKRGTNPLITKVLTEKYLPYFFKRHQALKMLYAVIRINNFASLRLVKNLGFKITGVLKNHEMVKGLPLDCAFASILKEQVVQRGE